LFALFIAAQALALIAVRPILTRKESPQSQSRPEPRRIAPAE
jgi:hypothetical protein